MFIPMNSQNRKEFRHLLLILGYTGDHLITCSKVWFISVRYEITGEAEREGQQLLEYWNTAGNSAFPHLSLIYCLLFAKISDTDVSPGSKSSFLPHLIHKGPISTPLKSLITIFAHKNKPRKKNY